MSILTSHLLGYQKALTLRTRFTAPNNVRIGYVMVGRPIAWENGDTPPTYYDTAQAQYDTATQLLGGKKVTGNDVQLVVPRKNWVANTVYVSYDDRSNTLFNSTNSMYVYTSSRSVYKCLYNANNSPSTIEPSDNYLINNGFISPGDGYVWKYMYKIDASDKFITSEWIPVPTEQNAGYFGSANNIVVGAIGQIVIESQGTGYNQNTTNVVIRGSGVSGAAEANVSNGKITSITMNNYGVNYLKSNCSVIITGDGSGANVRPVIGERYGHAFNPAKELGANTVMFSVKIGDGDATEGGKITTNNNFRQVALLMEPHKYGENTAVTIETANLAVSMVTQVILTSGTSYTLDEIVYQGTDLANAYFKGYVSDVFTNAVDLVGLEGRIAAGELLKGNTSGVNRTVVSVTNPDLEIGSGNLVYIENRAPINRSPSQAETVKLIIRF